MNLIDLYIALIDTLILIVLIVEYRYDSQVYDKVLVKVASTTKRGKHGVKKQKIKTITVSNVANEKLEQL